MRNINFIKWLSLLSFVLFFGLTTKAQVYTPAIKYTDQTIYIYHAGCASGTASSNVTITKNGTPFTAYTVQLQQFGLYFIDVTPGALAPGDILHITSACNSSSFTRVVEDVYSYITIPNGATYTGNNILPTDADEPYVRLNTPVQLPVCATMPLNSHVNLEWALTGPTGAGGSGGNATRGVYKINGVVLNSSMPDYLERFGNTGTPPVINTNGSITTYNYEMPRYGGKITSYPFTIEYTADGSLDGSDIGIRVGWFGFGFIQKGDSGTASASKYTMFSNGEFNNLVHGTATPTSTYKLVVDNVSYRYYIDNVLIRTVNRTVQYSTTCGTLINTATSAIVPNGAVLVYGTGVTLTPTPGSTGPCIVTANMDEIYGVTQSINIIPNNSVAPNGVTRTVCINTAMSPVITQVISGGATGIGTATGLPPGVTASYASATKTITISGTPTTAGVYSYTIPLTGGCGTVTANGTITVTANNTAATVAATTLCINTAISRTQGTTGATGIGTPTGLPAGVTATWSSNTITFGGSPTATGTFNYSIPLTGGCGGGLATGQIIVNPNRTVTSNATRTLCVNTALTPAITHTTTGATGIGTPTGLPTGVSASFGSNTVTISGTPTVTGTFNYTIPLTGGCGTANATGTIVVTSNNTAATVAATTLCINTTISRTQGTTGATGIGTPTGLPAGVTVTWASNTITFVGSPTATGTFNYSIPLIGGCGGGLATGTIVVTATNTAASVAATTLCINTAISRTQATTGATGIGTPTGLPAGVTASWASNTITFSGSPTATGTFNYSIPLTGGCGGGLATGTIVVTSTNTAATVATTTLCVNTPITRTQTTTGATGIGTPTGLPAGVTASWASNTITFSGSPTATGTFNYTIPLTGGCGTANATGTIVVTAANTAASVATTTLCVNTPITRTQTTTGATGIGTPTGLPAGVTASWASNTITFSGSPTATGTFNYTIPLTGGCGTANATGTIVVTAANTAASVATTTLCVNTPITRTQTTTGATGIGTPTGLPTGVTATWASNTITFSGSPTATGTFNYTIPLTGGCGTVNATGTIVVTSTNTAATVATTTLCVNTPITRTQATTGATGIGTPTGLPAGVTASWASNMITFSGSPTATGTFNYTIPLTGGCGTANATGTIVVNGPVSITINPATPGTVCQGGTTILNALPAGGTWTSNSPNAVITANNPDGTANVTISASAPLGDYTFNYSHPGVSGTSCSNAVNNVTLVTVIGPKTVTSNAAHTLCLGTALSPAITHTTTGATNIGTPTGLPAGVTAVWASNTITISGTPTATGTFNYTIPLTGGCGTVNATGTIIVTATNTATTNAARTLCLGTALSPAITHTTTGATNIGTPTGLPAGVTAVWASNTITISGTPTATGTFNYTIPLTGGCGTVNATGTIVVNAINTVTSNLPQTVCIGEAFLPITHTTTGATGIGTPIGLPLGITASFSGNTITLSGTPASVGSFDYEIPLTGGCGGGSATGSVIVENCDDPCYSGKVYLSQNPNTRLIEVQIGSNPFTFPIVGTLATNNPSNYQYNASAFNPVDGYIYAMNASDTGQQRRQLLQVNPSDGSIVNLGLVSGLTLPSGTFTYNAGEMTPDGNYYIRRGAGSGQMFRIDVSTLTATAIPLNYTGTGSIPESNDFAYYDGKLYFVNNASGANAGRLVTIDVATGNMSFVGTGVTNPSLAFGAMFGSANGAIYGVANQGGFYQFDTTTGTSTLISESPTTSVNDGAFNVTQNLSFSADLEVTMTNPATEYVPGSTTTYTVVAANNGEFGVLGANVTVDVPAGIPAANVSYTAVASSGSSTSVSGTQTGAVSDEVSLPVNGTVTYTIIVTVPASFDGQLVNEASITPPLDRCDPDTDNNAASVILDRVQNNTYAVNDINNTFIDTPVSGNVLTNDFDLEGDTQVVTTTGTFATSEGGSVTLNANGSYVYTPALGFIGNDTFEYTICDNGIPQACDTAVVSIEVIAIPCPDCDGYENDVVAVDDTATTNAGVPVLINVIANDYDPEGDNFEITDVTDPSNGTLVNNGDGTFTYTPNDGFTGEDTFTYTICDDGEPQACDEAVVTITVLPGEDNDTFANDDTYNGNQNAPITGNVLDNDFDPEGDNQTVTGNTQPANGTVVVNPDGTFVYTPDAGYHGPDSFTYTVCDDGTPQACDTATVSLLVNPVNTTYAINDINNTFIDTPVSGNVLTNDFDLEGDTQVVTTTGTFATSEGGSVTLNANGSYVYTPALGFLGVDTFEYTVCDNGIPQACDTAVVSIEVIAIPCPDCPGYENDVVAVDDTATTLVGVPVQINVMANDYDPEGDDFSITPGSVTDPECGTVALNAGIITYDPAGCEPGVYTFEYEICDNGNPVSCDTATVTVTVLPDTEPNYTFANDDAYNGDQNAPITGNVLDNDTDPEGDNQTVTGNTQPANGTVVVNPDGTFVYTPNADYHGPDSFTYTVCDDGTPQACDTATVSLLVNPVNTTYAINDINATFIDTPVSGNVLTNDFDLEGDTQVVTTTGTFATSEGGSITLNANGSYVYTPALGFLGVDTFEYTICDNGTPQACDTAIVTITVIPFNGPNSVVATDDTAVTPQGIPVTIPVLVNDFDPQDDSFAISQGTINSFPQNIPGVGTIVYNNNGTFTFTPVSDFVGEATFEYEICDDGEPQACDTATVTITVIEDTEPNYTFANDDVYYGQANTPFVMNNIAGNILANDFDPEGHIQIVNTTPVVNVPAGHTLVLSPNGNFVYTPAFDFVGTVSFVYEICDNGTPQACDQATVYIVIGLDPSIELLKDGVYFDVNGDGVANVGDEIRYTFTVTNTGNVTVTDITISDDNAVVTGGPVDLAPGESDTTSFTAVHVLTQADIDAGYVYNLALAVGEDPNGDPVEDESEDPTPCDTCPVDPDCEDCTITEVEQDPSIELLKDGVYFDVNGDGVANVGDEIRYTFTVTNTGNVTVTDITISDDNAVVTGGPVDLAPGESDTTSFTAVHVLTQADIDAGYVYNLALAVGEDPNGDPVEDESEDPTPCETCPEDPGCEDCTITEIPQDPSIELLKDGVYFDVNGDGVANVGDEVRYTFTVTNTGNVTVTDITISDDNAVVTGGPIDLAPGESDTTTFTGVHVLTQADIDAGYVYNLALAVGEDPNGDPVEDESEDPTPCDTCPVDPECEDCTITEVEQDPSIELLKDGVYFDVNGDGVANVGDEIRYTFTVTNTGNVTVTDITISDDNAVVTGGPVDLAPGESDTTSFTAVHVLTQADIDAGYVYNLALAVGEDPNGDPVEDESEDPTPCDTCPVDPDCEDCTITEVEQDPSIELLKDGVYFDVNGDGVANVGDEIRYTFTVTNTGNVTVTDITISDDNAVVTGGPVDLAPGESDTTSFTAVHVLTQADIDAGYVYNLALAVGEDPNGDPVEDESEDPTPCDTCPVDPDCEDCTITEVEQDPSIELLKDGVYFDVNGDGVANVGDEVRYTFTVTNTGNVTVTDITISDDNAVVTGGPIDLAPGESDTTTFTGVHVLTQADIDAGYVYNLALAVGEDPNGDPVEDESEDPTPCDTCPVDPDCEDCTITEIPQDPSIELLKDGVYFDVNGDGVANVGDEVRYTFTVTNTGNVTVTDITISDDNAVVTGGPIDLAPGESDTTSFTAVHVLTQADIDAGYVYNLALAVGEDPNGDPVEDESEDPTPCDTCPVDPDCEDCTITEVEQDPSIELLKDGVYSDTDDVAGYSAGDTITYIFTVTNTGNVTIDNIVVNDPMLNDGNDIAVVPSTLSPGEVGTVSVDYIITQGDIDAGMVMNIAFAVGEDPNGDPVEDESEDPTPLYPGDPITYVPLPQDPAIALTKEGYFNDENGDGYTQAGETITYTFVVTNTGNTTLYNVVLEEQEFTGQGSIPQISFVSSSQGSDEGTLLVGEYATYTATYSIVPEDLAVGLISNQAVVTAESPLGDEISDLSDDPLNMDDIDADGDGDPDDPTVVILPDGCTIIVYNGISPNGDGINDYLHIQGLDCYRTNTLEIYNRWGVKVFETTDYENDGINSFRGYSDGRVTIKQRDGLPTGTYYYILNYIGFDGNGHSKAGFIHLEGH